MTSAKIPLWLAEEVELVGGGGVEFEVWEEVESHPLVRWEHSRPVPPPRVLGPSTNEWEDHGLSDEDSWRTAQMFTAVVV